jgi:hypothetical protein
MQTSYLPEIRSKRPAWDRRRIVGQKRSLLPKLLWAIRVSLEIADEASDLALFNMAVNRKLRGCGLIRHWVKSIGLEPSSYCTHSMRRTKVSQIYKKMGNLCAVQLLLGHTKMDSTVRCLGLELEGALAIPEGVEFYAFGPVALLA